MLPMEAAIPYTARVSVNTIDMLGSLIAVVNQSVTDTAAKVIAPPQRHLQRRGDHRGVV